VKKIGTVAMRGNEIFRELKLTVGLDLGDRASHYRILDEDPGMECSPTAREGPVTSRFCSQ